MTNTIWLWVVGKLWCEAILNMLKYGGTSRKEGSTSHWIWTKRFAIFITRKYFSHMLIKWMLNKYVKNNHLKGHWLLVPPGCPHVLMHLGYAHEEIWAAGEWGLPELLALLSSREGTMFILNQRKWQMAYVTMPPSSPASFPLYPRPKPPEHTKNFIWLSSSLPSVFPHI